MPFAPSSFLLPDFGALARRPTGPAQNLGEILSGASTARCGRSPGPPRQRKKEQGQGVFVSQTCTPIWNASGVVSELDQE